MPKINILNGILMLLLPRKSEYNFYYLSSIKRCVDISARLVRFDVVQ